MAERDEKILRAYIERAMALHDERREELDADELAQIARELGLGDDDLAALEEDAAAHALRAARFIDIGRFDDAIGELGEALAVAPRRAAWLYELARAHAGRWKASGSSKDRQRAEQLARHVVEIDPAYEASYALLKSLDEKPPRPPSKAGGVVKFLAGCGCLPLCLMLVGIFGNMIESGPKADRRSPAQQKSAGVKSPDTSTDTSAPDSAPQLSVVKRYAEACEAGKAEACTNLGYHYERGDGVAEDPARAVELYGKGCDGGHAEGCAAAKRMAAAP